MPSDGVSTERKYQQSRAVQTLLLATATTFILVSTEQVVDTGSAKITVAAVTLGVITGILAPSLMSRYQLPIGTEHTNDAITVGIASIVVVIVTAILWILLPEALFERIPYAGVSFVWTFAFAVVTRDVIWPKTRGTIE